MYRRYGRSGRTRPETGPDTPPALRMPSRRARIAILAIRYGMAALIGIEAVLLQRVTSSPSHAAAPFRAVSVDNVLVFLVVFALFALAPTAVLLGMTDEDDVALAWRRLARTTVPVTIVALGLVAALRMF
jgi:hypothetical protein